VGLRDCVIAGGGERGEESRNSRKKYLIHERGWKRLNTTFLQISGGNELFNLKRQRGGPGNPPANEGGILLHHVTNWGGAVGGHFWGGGSMLRCRLDRPQESSWGDKTWQSRRQPPGGDPWGSGEKGSKQNRYSKGKKGRCSF